MENLEKYIEEIESCNYECEAGYLKNHMAWGFIKQAITQANKNFIKPDVIFRIGAPCWGNFGGNNLTQAIITNIAEDGTFEITAMGTEEVMGNIPRNLFRPRANM